MRTERVFKFVDKLKMFRKLMPKPRVHHSERPRHVLVQSAITVDGILEERSISQRLETLPLPILYYIIKSHAHCRDHRKTKLVFSLASPARRLQVPLSSAVSRSAQLPYLVVPALSY